MKTDVRVDGILDNVTRFGPLANQIANEDELIAPLCAKAATHEESDEFVIAAVYVPNNDGLALLLGTPESKRNEGRFDV